jgi:Flp pilus assembly protein TadG
MSASRSQSERRHGRAGAALIETALTLALFLTVLFGIIETSLAAYAYHFISHAAREGTRYAIVRGKACNTFASACPATADDIQAHVRSLAFPGINETIGVVTTWSPTNDPGGLVQVAVTYPYHLSLPFMPVMTINMTSTSEMVISQ